MKIYLNGETKELDDGSTAEQLVTLLELGGRRIAMELNGKIVTRSHYMQQTLHEGDRVEIVHAIGGGSLN